MVVYAKTIFDSPPQSFPSFKPIECSGLYKWTGHASAADGSKMYYSTAGHCPPVMSRVEQCATKLADLPTGELTPQLTTDKCKCPGNCDYGSSSSDTCYCVPVWALGTGEASVQHPSAFLASDSAHCPDGVKQWKSLGLHIYVEPDSSQAGNIPTAPGSAEYADQTEFWLGEGAAYLDPIQVEAMSWEHLPYGTG